MPPRRKRELLWECPPEVRLVGLAGPCAMLTGIYVNTQRFVGGRPAYAKGVHFPDGTSTTAWLAASGRGGAWALRPATGYRREPWPVLGGGGGGGGPSPAAPGCPPGREEPWPLGRRGRAVRVEVPAGASRASCGQGDAGQEESYALMPDWAAAASYEGGFRPDCWMAAQEHYYFCCQNPPGLPSFNLACFSHGREYEFCCHFEHGPSTRNLPARWQRVVHLDIAGQRLRLWQNASHQHVEPTSGCMLWLDGIARLLLLGHFRWMQRPQMFLDIGAGLGLAAIAAARVGHTVLGIEPGRCALEHARRNVAADPVARGKVNLVPFDVCDGPAAFREHLDSRNWFDVVLIEGLGCLGPAVVRCIAVLTAAVGSRSVLVVVDEPVPEFRLDFEREFTAVGLHRASSLDLGLFGWSNPHLETVISIWSRRPPPGGDETTAS